MTSRRHTVLHELRADHGRGWVAWLHLDQKGRVAKLYLQRGRQAWRVDRSVPLLTDALKLGASTLPWEVRPPLVLWRVDCDRPQLWQGLEAAPGVDGPPQGLQWALAAVLQGSVRPSDLGGRDVQQAIALRAALPPRYLELYDSQADTDWPEGGPLAVVVHRLEQLAAPVERTSTGDAAQLYATLARARNLLEAKRLRAAA